jgi:hypothetical protein
MKYISISEDNNICFKDDDINIILNTDKPISDELYNMFFEQQSMGKSFKLKNIDGTTFEEIFEEYQPTNDTLEEQPLSETEELKQRVAQLEEMVQTFLKENQNK